MSNIPRHLQAPMQPVANPAAVVSAANARFTVLTPRLIRLEYSPDQRFEDRASQAFWFRDQPAPAFTVTRHGGRLILETDYLRLVYDENAAEFTSRSLWIELKAFSTTWRYGDANPTNLKGTGRTLDNVEGEIPLEDGLMSRSGWAVIDDSRSLVFNVDGWLEPRGNPGALDLYFFGYSTAYQECLDDYIKVSGKIVMLPRWAFGNWWSRYYAYSQQELSALMREFRAHDVPLSVCIIDMDWHITRTGNASSGWTGYTWNRELFPDPQGMLDFLHDNGLRTALNLHPADGIHSHEAQYEEFARLMGVDPDGNEPIEFDIANHDFMRHYFEVLHHPQEAMGVDFWWLDWQQGRHSKMEGLDPLWFLNHLHFYDLGRDGSKRPFIFSRWGGYGNHRYPLGFSGDSIVSWRSLAFQPYFTATAANVGFGWWSHDIGGHFFGKEDPEMYARWVQFGLFSPILRLHSTANPFHERRPYAQRDLNAAIAASDALRLRHAFIPYLYAMGWKTTSENRILARPMYYSYPNHDEAYACSNQYEFGTELIAAPFITPIDKTTNVARQVVWLPDGDWYHFFTGEHYRGGGWHAVYGTLQEIPVFARSGAIVPLAENLDWSETGCPEALEVRVFAGADNTFELYEDDGVSNAYADGHYSITPIRQQFDGTHLTISIGAAEGDTSHLPAQREYTLTIYGMAADVTLADGNGVIVGYDAATEALTVALGAVETAHGAS
nr:glycoside hydrolase family 31 protein [Aggregatilineales bacterium]